MNNLPPQLCRSATREGDHDDMIKFLIRNGIKNHTILTEMMKETRGHENPRVVLERILMLQEQMGT